MKQISLYVLDNTGSNGHKVFERYLDSVRLDLLEDVVADLVGVTGVDLGMFRGHGLCW